MKKLKIGLVGLGFIGTCHMDAIRRISFAELAAVTDVNYELASKKADEEFITKCYGTVDELLADDEIDIVHNCTPNNLHMEINEKIIKAGKHIFSEKPLALTSGESARMLALLSENRKIVHGVNFNYRMNPLVQETRNKVANGEIGRTMLIHGSYLQDWLMYDTDYNWRLEPEISGMSRAIADIGSHWMDTSQVVTGSKITEVCADISTILPVRKKPKSQVKTFSVNANAEYEDKEIKTEDYGAVLFKMSNGERGVFYVSQISAGKKNNLNFEIDGSKASISWNQEVPDRMWMGHRDRYNSEVIRDPNLMTDAARQYAYIPVGHAEGWNDAVRNNIGSFYRFISEGKSIGKDAHDFATFEDGHLIMKLTEAILTSSKKRCWIEVK